ncbi:conserved hypothetical protein [Trichinella spiralis]|uniref:hypothetical protein n=1 Tax=Trichinella spiralis TaxID=6334 RepID=UPI0001EFD17B|nr:conserved hypothetical protein [Trichinella spiralis]
MNAKIRLKEKCIHKSTTKLMAFLKKSVMKFSHDLLINASNAVPDQVSGLPQYLEKSAIRKSADKFLKLFISWGNKRPLKLVHYRSYLINSLSTGLMLFAFISLVAIIDGEWRGECVCYCTFATLTDESASSQTALKLYNKWLPNLAYRITHYIVKMHISISISTEAQSQFLYMKQF